MQCNLKSIGELKNIKGQYELVIHQEYVKGLKNLEMFSHILLTVYSENPANSGLSILIAQIKDIDLVSGYIALKINENVSDTEIFDIKPYIPCEDRVLSAESQENPLDTDSLSHSKEISLASIAKTAKSMGKQLIVFDGSSKSIVDTLNKGDYVRIIWWFSNFDKQMYRKTLQVNPPYEDAPKSGVFATRSPVRPNPVAVSTAKILDIKDSFIEITEIEAYNDTPVLGIIQYYSGNITQEAIRVPIWMKHWKSLISFSNDNTAVNNVKYLNLNKYFKYEQEETELQKSKNNDQTELDYIVIEGARQNNLKNISLKIPKHKFSVITGLSGSGKSSLAFDTIYAEAERRFTGSFSTAGSVAVPDKPDFDKITGLSPAIAIEQNRIIRNSRSTVGSLSGLYGLLRTLYSTFGTRFCEVCGTQYHYFQAQELIDLFKSLNSETDISIRSSKKIIVESVKTAVSEDLKNLENKITSEYNIHHKLALEFTDGTSIIVTDRKSCAECGNLFFDLKPYMFSNNNPEGMCTNCNGTGFELVINEDSVVAYKERSILDEASAWWGNLRKFREKPSANWMRGEVFALASHFKIDLEKPWNKLPEQFRHHLLYGYNDEKVTFRYESSSGRSGNITRYASGAVTNIERLTAQNKAGTTEMLSRFCTSKTCSHCNGTRIGPVGRNIYFAEKFYPEAAAMSIEAIINWCYEIGDSKHQPLLNQIIETGKSISGAGLEYLSLNRPVPTLSGGELQRLILSTRMHSGLTDLLYVLDEPSKGLHPYDHRKITEQIRQLADDGNTVIVVEHVEGIIRQADHIVDLGPESGVKGGKVIVQGNLHDIINNKDSKTGYFLSNKKQVPPECKTIKEKGILSITGACKNNLKNIDLEIPLGNIISVTGVSGSGKSTLVYDVLSEAYSDFKEGNKKSSSYMKANGFKLISEVVVIDQKPVWKSVRSNAATYLGVFNEIRKIFAALPESNARSYKEGMFSTNSAKGQCPTCKGLGYKKLSLGFLNDIKIKCDSCKGKRYKSEILEIKYRNHSIADVLDMDIKQVTDLFSGYVKVTDPLKCLIELGLDYIKIGQSTSTLSGGESQRLKLAEKLNSPYLYNALIVLDEPTSGLHSADVQRFMNFVRRLNARGATIIMIEHNMNVVSMSDWVIDLGPGGGNMGGQIIAVGTPIDILADRDSFTAQCLKSITK